MSECITGSIFGEWNLQKEVYLIKVFLPKDDKEFVAMYFTCGMLLSST